MNALRRLSMRCLTLEGATLLCPRLEVRSVWGERSRKRARGSLRARTRVVLRLQRHLLPAKTCALLRGRSALSASLRREVDRAAEGDEARLLDGLRERRVCGHPVGD